ncbi:MAG TPA: hypothetical protein VL201_01845 [Patescibacteria group bacterium]|jgi:hypothetical protein|nr:hypothetical protein [Patescibacteria group bacterium]
MLFNKAEKMFFLMILFFDCASNAMHNQQNSTVIAMQSLNLHNNQPFENLSQPLDTLEAFSTYENQYLAFVNQLDNTSHDNQPSLRQHYYDFYCKKRQEYMFILYFDLVKKYKDLEKKHITAIQNKNAKTDSDVMPGKEWFKNVGADFAKGALCTVGVLGLIHFHYLVTHPR